MLNATQPAIISVMISFIVALVLLLIALIALTLRKTYYYLPEAELKRQARDGNNLAKVLYRAVTYGASLRLLLWIIIGVSAAVGLELFVRIAPIVFGIVLVAIILWLGFAWMPTSKLTGYGARVTVWFTPTIVWLLDHLNPVFSRLTGWWHKHFPLSDHTGLYEREDLLQIIQQQERQADNRIPKEILELMRHALHFDTYHVADVTVPRAQVRTVKANDPVGPILLDELHDTGHTRFPVCGQDSDDIIGTLHVITLDEAKHGGRVSSYMDKQVAYLHEQDNLAEALRVVYQTKQQLFVVVNSFEEYVGITTLEDILTALLGNPNRDGFDAHHDKRAVSGKHAKAAPETAEPTVPASGGTTETPETEPEKVSPPDETVVE